MATTMTAAMGAIVSALKSIPSVGDRVYRGRRTPDLEDSKTAVLPAVTVVTMMDTPRIPQPTAVRVERQVEVRGFVRESAINYEPEMDALAAEMYRAIVPLTDAEHMPAGVTGFELTGVEYEQPEPGSDLMSVLFILNVSFVLTLQEGT